MPLLPVTQADGVDCVIRVRGMVNRFGSQTVHHDLDFDMKRGEILGVVGGSGSGKSVLMRAIIGLRPPQAGRVEVLGLDTATLTAEGARQLRQGWGVLFQEGALFSGLTVAENIQAPMREYLGLPQPLLDELAGYKLHMVGLPAEAGAKYPSELSGGMKKRAGLARALALDPQLLFLDEPTAGLDPIAAAAFDELIKVLRDTLQLSVFLITHDLDTLHAICDRVAVLADGQLVAIGTIAELRELQHPWLQRYFAGPRGRAASGQQGHD
jgi:phospholipid/cholesterol/gamma-HCH transport system ATP-binding protein